MTAHVHVAGPLFSETTLEQLRGALHLYISSSDEARHETLRHALERLRTEAHAQRLGPEKMQIAVNMAWARVPGIARVDHTRTEVAFKRVVEFCIAAYYGEPQ